MSIGAAALGALVFVVVIAVVLGLVFLAAALVEDFPGCAFGIVLVLAFIAAFFFFLVNS